MMELSPKDVVFLVTQAVMVGTMISTNRNNIKNQKQQIEELKGWLKSLQEKVNDIRVKVGV
jgi:hypothetical protein